MIRVLCSSSLQIVFTTWEQCTGSELLNFFPLCPIIAGLLIFSIFVLHISPVILSKWRKHYFNLRSISFLNHSWLFIVACESLLPCNRSHFEPTTLSHTVHLIFWINNLEVIGMLHRWFYWVAISVLQLCSAIAKGSSCCRGDINYLVFTCFKIGSVGIESWTRRSMLCCATGQVF